ncbi:hypothetical protein [Janibacter sp. GS2]|uniref:hypothetical protein n=1 Tax=Janibacter sp. GS2 TaxID=3442646 RepID=UPI003EBA29ED
MTAGLEVRGGAGGLTVQLTQLERAAGVLQSVGGDVAETAIVIGLAAAEPSLALAGVLAPVEYAAAELAICRCVGPTGAGGIATEILASAVTTRAAVATYRTGEAAVEALFDGAATAVGAGVGATVGAAAPAVTAVAVGVALSPGARIALQVPGARERVLAVGLGLGQGADEILADHPWLVPAAADGLDGLVLGVGVGRPALGTWLSWRSGRLGVPYPPRTRAEALGVILAATRGAALDESDQDVSVRVHRQGGGRAPTGVTDLVAAHGPTSGGSRVRLTGVPRADGTWTWVVDVPGTQTFHPRAGANPWDLTSNVLLSSGRATLTTRAVSRALADAQRRTGSTLTSRVMLTGHSQGGLTAAALAADPAFRERHGVTHVVTSGAPIATVGVPEEVSVLSLEHAEDLVPGLEGEDNPDRESWVTVRRAVADELGPDARATQAHHVGRYAETARLVDASDDPSLASWRRGASNFLDGEGGEAVVIDYDIERVPRE